MFQPTLLPEEKYQDIGVFGFISDSSMSEYEDTELPFTLSFISLIFVTILYRLFTMTQTYPNAISLFVYIHWVQKPINPWFYSDFMVTL